MHTTLRECREPGEGRERLKASGKGWAVGVVVGRAINAATAGEKSAAARSRERAISIAVCSA